MTAVTSRNKWHHIFSLSHACSSKVDVPTVVYGSSILSTVLYIAIGLLGAFSIPNVSENMLESMMTGTMGNLMQIGASIFAFAIIGYVTVKPCSNYKSLV